MDARKIYADRLIKGLPLQRVLEGMRITLVHAMMHGKAVVVRMGDTVADFLTCDDDHCPNLDPLFEAYPPFGKLAYVPSMWYHRGGSILKSDAVWPKRMYRRKELDRGRITPVCHANFGVLFTTTMGMDELSSRVFNGTTGLPEQDFEVVSLLEMLQEQRLIEGGDGDGDGYAANSPRAGGRTR